MTWSQSSEISDRMWLEMMTVSFYPLNFKDSTISNGAFRFLLRFYKTI